MSWYIVIELKVSTAKLIKVISIQHIQWVGLRISQNLSFTNMKNDRILDINTYRKNSIKHYSLRYGM